MLNIFKSHHPVRHAKSFKYAFEGIFHALINEPNFRIQVIVVSIATAGGIVFKIANVEWAILTISMGLLLAAEMINTVVEEVVDAYVKDYQEVAKIVKDLAAGFVLITAIVAALVLFFVFSPFFK